MHKGGTVDKNKVQLNTTNFKKYRENLDKSFKEELSLFDRFSESIIHKAQTHRQITLNNLKESEESIKQLKSRVEEIKKSIFFHVETLVIDRQRIILDTEENINKHNQKIIEFEYKNAENKVRNFDYLNKALLQSVFDFFNEFKMYYSKDIIDLEDLYSFLEEKNRILEKIIQKYQFEVLELFSSLDKEIFEVNDKISNLIKNKNSQLQRIYDFYQKETSSYLDNQLTFSSETNLGSQEIKDLLIDKVEQFKNFKIHLLSQEEKIRLILHDEYKSLYDKILIKQLQRIGNVTIHDPCFFDHVENSLIELKEKIIYAKNENSPNLDKYIKRYLKVADYQKLYNLAEEKTRQITKKFLKMKKGVFFTYQKESRKLINQMNNYFHLYKHVLKVDPFLAQIIGDKATKIVKDEINYLSTLRINKEHKINVNYDLKTLKLNQQINEIEEKLIYEVERQLYLQDIDILSHLLDIQIFFIEKKTDTALSKNHLLAEKNNIFKLEKAINSYIKYDTRINNINRKYLNFITSLMINHVRIGENHNINLVDALSDIKLALKEYDITSIHFKNMFDNEKRFLLMQSARVDEETKINNEFILTGLLNKMRFAEEQIKLANDEFKLRVQAINEAVNEERDYYDNIIENQLKVEKKKKRDIIDDYQAILYRHQESLVGNDDPKIIKTIEKEFEKVRNKYEKLIENSNFDINQNQIVVDAKRRLDILNDHLEEALEEAVNLREDTISEMQELYNSSKEKYDYLKVYLEQKVNPMEPTFYQTLERMKSRYQFKLKTAEAELDIKTKDLLENYIKVYFEDKPELDRLKISDYITNLQLEKDQVTEEYRREISDIENDFKNQMKDFQLEKEQIITKVNNLKNSIKTKEEIEISHKNNELQILENSYNLQTAKNRVSFEKEMANLTKEYNETLMESKKHIMNLSNAFDKILNTYKPYVKLTRNNRKIRQIMHQIKKESTKKEKQELKALARKLKRKRLLISE